MPNVIDEKTILEKERKRVADIEAAIGDAVGPLVTDLRAKAMSGEIDLTQLQAALLVDLRASRPRLPGIHVGGKAPESKDVLTAAFMLKAGHEKAAVEQCGEQVCEQAKALSKKPLLDFLRAAHRIDGTEAPSDPDELAASSVGGVSTTSLPVSLGNAMNKSLMSFYRSAPATWRSFCQVKNANDFKLHQGVKPSARNQYAKIGSDGELKSTELGEDVFPFQIETWGRTLSFSRQAFINDDLSILDSSVPLLAQQAARAVSDEVFVKLIANADNFFSAGNGNLLTAAPLEFDNLALAVETLRNRLDSDGNNIDLQPSVLLVSPANEQRARQLLESTQVESATGERIPTGNSLKGVAQLQVDARLANTGKFPTANADDWYVFAPIEAAPRIVAFLNGMDAPRIDFFGLDADFRKLSMGWRSYLDFGVASGDFRAAVKAEAA